MLLILKEILGRHQFASDGLLLMIVGAAGVYLRALPVRVWVWLVGQTTMTITVKDDDAAFVWVKEWFQEQTFLSRIRRVDLDTRLRGERPSLIPAEGHRWFWYGGRPFRVEFYRSEEGKGWSGRRTEWMAFRTIGRRQEFLKRFVNDIVECHARTTALKSSLYVRDEYWTEVEGYVARSMDSVILKAGEKERVLGDIENFRSSRNRYWQLGVPYHRGYLLYGPPGTGKTSLVSAIAGKFGLSVYAISLTDFNDRTLMKAVRDVPPNSVILFEDIDCMKAGKARADSDPTAGKALPKEKEDELPSFGVTLSGLLNVLDGFYAPDNVLFVMTTNKIEVLDPALLRPGRIDYRLFMGEAEDEQKIELYLRFFPQSSRADAGRFVARHRSASTMAEFQGALLRLEQRSYRFSLDLESGDVVDDLRHEEQFE